MSIELLAPAGSPEVLNAVIGEGADAVYMGLRDMNARQRAKNFSYSQFEAAVDKLHEMGKKVFVTMNTIFEDWEAAKVFNLLKYLNGVGPDALIVQDLGLVELINTRFPDLKIHASTQMNISSSQGVNFLSRYKVGRVVLGRELTLDEIRLIRQKTNTELEVFVHGALCISVSGLCLFSSFLGGKSGNKGVCSQPCRRLYKSDEEQGYFFSPKDLMLIDHIPELIDAGVNSIKIEGRLRSAEYAAMVVKAYRLVIDNYMNDREGAIHDAKKILTNDFARKKTHYYINDRKNTDFFNPKQAGGTGLYLGTIKEVLLTFDKRLGVIKTDVDLSINDTVRIHNAADTLRKSVKIKTLKHNRGNIHINLPPEFNKDDSVYLINKKELVHKYPSVLPKSLSRYKRHPGNSAPPEVDSSVTARPEKRSLHAGLYVKIGEYKDIFVTQSIQPEKLIISYTHDNARNLLKNLATMPYKRDRLIINLPAYFPEGDLEWLGKNVGELIEDGFTNFIANNAGHLNMLKRHKNVHCIAGPYLYAFNKYSIQFLLKHYCEYVVLPYENNKRNLNSTTHHFNGERFIVPVFAYPELFQVRKQLNEVYDFHSFEDKTGSTFFVVPGDEQSVVVPEKPFSIVDKIGILKKRGLNKFLVDFSHCGMSKSYYKNIMQHAQQREHITGTTRFNWKDGFYRPNVD